MILIEPPYTEPYVRWCERTGVNRSLLLDFVKEAKWVIKDGFMYLSVLVAFAALMVGIERDAKGIVF